MKIKIEKLNDGFVSNDSNPKINFTDVIKETLDYKNRIDDEIVVLNYLRINNNKELFDNIKNSYSFNSVTELILINDFYNIDSNNQFIKIQKHKNINNIKFSGICYLHSIWISDRGITVMGIFENAEINGEKITTNTVNINFDLGVVDIFGYISYESFVMGYKFAMENYETLKNESYVGFDLFHKNISKTINLMKEKYYK